jgi:type II secretory pathway component PulL
MTSFPDPYANPSRMRRLRLILGVVTFALFVLALSALKVAQDKKLESQKALVAAQAAEAMLPSSQVRRPVAAADPKQKIYLSDLRATAVKLSVDWGARISTVEQAMGADLSLNAFRIDAQKGEIELKGETSSNVKLTAIVSEMQRNGLDARIGRLARFQNGNSTGLEYSILIAWPER